MFPLLEEDFRSGRCEVMSVALNPRPIAVARNLVGRNLMEYDRMMRQRPGAVRDTAPANCRECPYYQPDWEHRCCLYTKCKYGKNIDVFKHR